MVTTATGVAALPATCPLCHTAHASASAALQTGESWTCLRCGQTWTGARLKTVAAYERYVAARGAR